ncbi:MAG: M20/M25/M40 family metallo-hydrolase [Rhodocyclaceae bacterium]|nr:M20/M25/M40 family metallo-hydrolase [Rhodocyclaceae bacterium]MCA3025054.1 M20/M25/M40 family metallo-hydrolase [Rhodocyclaceae bacterium]MCA3032416.1 M20/M25/M40 family metallo-hydrolase [Rhodocyclaceae bacterium]MCA3036745.1 M20/M25/M40 family metallo-hydrolase [Rhodocyclaceae bacterium]MCA3041096.1 M20/M25/M40 family metallo-hydrolase [Rhodocyclaceae bacterium]
MNRLIVAALFAVGLVSLANAASPALSPAEQKMVASIKERSPAALELLQKAVYINSGTMNPEGVRDVGKLFRAELDALGFTTKWVDMPPEMLRAGHLVATRTAKGKHKGKRLLLIGHLDTVFEKDSPVAPWKPDGKRIAGQGVSDMKGGNVIIIEALRAMQAAGTLDQATISVIFTGDEERVGSPIDVARADMITLARQSDVALAFEGMIRDVNGNEFASIARRASGGFTVNITARQGHSSGVFGPIGGYGAGYEAARIINAFREQLQEPNLTYSVGLMLVGTEVEFDDTLSKGTAAGKRNVIPPKGIVTGDLRYLTHEQRDRVRARMTEIVSKSLNGTSATVNFVESYPPMAPTDGNMEIFKVYTRVSEDAGLGKIELTAPSTRGAGDIQFVAPFLDCLDGLGAVGGGSHSPSEYLNPESIERNAIRAAILMHRLTR